jgi:hypothetical protein
VLLKYKYDGILNAVLQVAASGRLRITIEDLFSVWKHDKRSLRSCVGNCQITRTHTHTFRTNVTDTGVTSRHTKLYHYYGKGYNKTHL